MAGVGLEGEEGEEEEENEISLDVRELLRAAVSSLTAYN